MRAFFVSVKNWFVAHAPTRRRLIQLYAFLLYNANSKGFIRGEIFKGGSKYLCVPGLNCYSCPGAIAACPLGALQNAINASGTKTSYYVFGIIALFGLILGRTICGFLCPVGLGQELVYKIKTPKIRKSRYTRALSYLKYVILAVLVVAVPLLYALNMTPMPGFCKYICPAGTLEGGIALLLNPNNRGMLGLLGPIFTWKFVVLCAIVTLSIFMYRPFCRFLCPLGAIYGFFNRIALLGVSLDKTQCTDCGLCVQHCKMDVKRVGDHECINCGECISVCPAKAITWKGSKIFLRGNEIPQTAKIEPEVDIRTMNFGATAQAQSSPVLAAAGASATPTSAPSERTDTALIKQNVATETRGGSGAPIGKSDAPQNGKRKHDRNFWLRFSAWAAAIALLAGLLIYYNAFAGADDVIHGSEVGNRLTAFDATIYGDDLDFRKRINDGNLVLVLFDDAVEDETMRSVNSAVSDFKTEFADIAGGAEVFAIHPADMENGEEFVTSMGWNDLDIAFGGAESNAIFDSLGEVSLPVVLGVNSERIISSRLDGDFSQSRLTACMRAMYTGNKVGDFMPDFSVNIYGKNESGRITMLDEKFNSSDHLGNVMVVNFWATWCTPCVGELPFFNTVALDMPEVTFVAIHTTITEDVGKFIQLRDGGSWSRYVITFAQDEIQNNLPTTYTMLGGKDSMPTTLIVDSRGIITFLQPGSVTEDILRTEIQKASER